MAETKDPAELKKNALDALQTARVEVRDQLVSYRQDLNPANVVRSAMKKKPGWVIAGVTGIGLLIGRWLVRPNRTMPPDEVQRLAMNAAKKAVSAGSSKPSSIFAPLAFLAPVAALAGKSALPLIGKTIMTHFQNHKSQPVPPQTSGSEDWKPGEEH